MSLHIWSYLVPDYSEAEGDARDAAVQGLQPGRRAHILGHHVPLLPHPQVKKSHMYLCRHYAKWAFKQGNKWS